MHGWRVYDYIAYQKYRFSVRQHRWMMRNETLDESIAEPMQTLDLLCFSSQVWQRIETIESTFMSFDYPHRVEPQVIDCLSFDGKTELRADFVIVVAGRVEEQSDLACQVARVASTMLPYPRPFGPQLSRRTVCCLPSSTLSTRCSPWEWFSG